MHSPFPGMDPYIEHPEIWPDVHHGLIGELRYCLSEAIGARYYVAVEQRSYVLQPQELLLVGRPDVAVVDTGARGAQESSGGTAVAARPRTVTVPGPEEVRERYLEVRGVSSGNVVTVIEILSPWNKRRGSGRDAYLGKRGQILWTRTSLIEIDLLRGGERLPIVPQPEAPDYSILIARGDRRPRADLFSFGIRETIPLFPVPLAEGDRDVEADLGRILASVYDRARYGIRVDYRGEPVPPFEGEDARWADRLLREAGRRPH
ncbi:MAG: DUF4058 family protein [Planctomycetes bacterium]|nr:DUF4058 family protein [Planctomycetota bacterium]